MRFVLGLLLVLTLATAFTLRRSCFRFTCGKRRHRLSVRRGETREKVMATLVPDIGESALRQAEAWIPWLRENGAGDSAWDWRELLREARANTALARRYEECSLFLDGRLLAVMLLRTRGRRSRLPTFVRAATGISNRPGNSYNVLGDACGYSCSSGLA